MTNSSSSGMEHPQPLRADLPAEHHLFDFWIGTWEVYGSDGGIAGHSRIEPVSDGCGLSERWEGARGSRGVSYNAWDPGSHQWRQFWVGNTSGDVLCLQGGIIDGSMVLHGVRPSATTRAPQLQRIAWTPNADGTVRQHWQTSDDDGASWATVFDGLYRRKPD